MESRAENGSGVKKLPATNTRSAAIDGRSLLALQHTQRGLPQGEFEP